LRSRLTSNNTLFVQNEGGYVADAGFDWAKPATDNEIHDFEIEHSIILPETFKDFLKISNGAMFFKDIQYGQWGCKILGLDELISITKEVSRWGYELKPEWLVFATWLGDCDILVFDLEKSTMGSRNYIIDGDSGDRVADWDYLKGDFAHWIDRLIVSQGAKYWKWYY